MDRRAGDGARRDALGRVRHGHDRNDRVDEVVSRPARGDPRAGTARTPRSRPTARARSRRFNPGFARPGYPFAVDPSVAHDVLQAKVAALARAARPATRHDRHRACRRAERHRHRAHDRRGRHVHRRASTSTRPTWAICCRSPGFPWTIGAESRADTHELAAPPAGPSRVDPAAHGAGRDRAPPGRREPPLPRAGRTTTTSLRKQKLPRRRRRHQRRLHGPAAAARKRCSATASTSTRAISTTPTTRTIARRSTSAATTIRTRPCRPATPRATPRSTSGARDVSIAYLYWLQTQVPARRRQRQGLSESRGARRRLRHRRRLRAASLHPRIAPHRRAGARRAAATSTRALSRPARRARAASPTRAASASTASTSTRAGTARRGSASRRCASRFRSARCCRSNSTTSSRRARTSARRTSPRARTACIRSSGRSARRPAISRRSAPPRTSMPKDVYAHLDRLRVVPVPAARARRADLLVERRALRRRPARVSPRRTTAA